MSRQKVDPVELDGRTLEGGGQLVRIVVCLSALTGIPVRITHIRANRGGGGGLKAQHLAGVNWLARACGARMDGAKKGSQTLLFEPRQALADAEEDEEFAVSPAFKKVVRDKQPVYESLVDVGTAGSAALALQAILPFILFSKLPSGIPIHLTVRGGTNVSGSPSFEYVEQVLLPTLHGIGFPEIKADLISRGWSHGGAATIGEFSLTIPPRCDLALPAFAWQPPDDAPLYPTLHRLQGTFLAPVSFHKRFRAALNHALRLLDSREIPLPAGAASPTDLLALICEDSHHEKRISFHLVATLSASPAQEDAFNTEPRFYYLANDRLLENGSKYRRLSSDPATELASHVCLHLAREIRSTACADEHMRDQLVVFQALAQGRSAVWGGVDVDGMGDQLKPSQHAQTAEWVAGKMLGATFDGKGGCEGVGYGDETCSSEYGMFEITKRIRGL